MGQPLARCANSMVRGKTETLTKRLARFREELDTRILVSLRYDFPPCSSKALGF
jgi:hypothetical protein